MQSQASVASRDRVNKLVSDVSYDLRPKNYKSPKSRGSEDGSLGGLSTLVLENILNILAGLPWLETNSLLFEMGEVINSELFNLYDIKDSITIDQVTNDDRNLRITWSSTCKSSEWRFSPIKGNDGKVSLWVSKCHKGVWVKCVELYIIFKDRSIINVNPSLSMGGERVITLTKGFTNRYDPIGDNAEELQRLTEKLQTDLKALGFDLDLSRKKELDLDLLEFFARSGFRLSDDRRVILTIFSKLLLSRKVLDSEGELSRLSKKQSKDDDIKGLN